MKDFNIHSLFRCFPLHILTHFRLLSFKNKSIFNILSFLHIFFILLYFFCITKKHVSYVNIVKTIKISKYVYFKYPHLFAYFRYLVVHIVCILRIYVILSYFRLFPFWRYIGFATHFLILLFIACIFLYVSYFNTFSTINILKYVHFQYLHSSHIFYVSNYV